MKKLKQKHYKSFTLQLVLIYLVLFTSFIFYYVNRIRQQQLNHQLALLLLKQQAVENYIFEDIYDSHADLVLNDKSFNYQDCQVNYRIIDENTRDLSMYIDIVHQEFSYKINLKLAMDSNKVIYFEYER